MLRKVSIGAYLVALTSLSGAQRIGATMQPFTVRGSDGQKYTLANLTAGKPVLLFYLEPNYKWTKIDEVTGQILDEKVTGFEKPDRTADLDRLVAMTKGKIRVVALCSAKPKEMQWLRNHHKVKFLMVGDDKQYSAMELQNQILIDNAGGMHQSALSSLQSALILPDGRLVQVWQGLSRKSLAEMQRDVRKYTGVLLHLDLSKFPRRQQAGPIGMFGEPYRP